MNKYSSKHLSLSIVRAYIETTEIPDEINGILLLTSFGIVYGEFHNLPNGETPKTISDVLITVKTDKVKNFEDDNVEIFGDGTTIVLKNAVVKYSTGITLNMDEIIIFSDQVVGYYPIDLSVFDNQIS